MPFNNKLKKIYYYYYFYKRLKNELSLFYTYNHPLFFSKNISFLPWKEEKIVKKIIFYIIIKGTLKQKQVCMENYRKNVNRFI